MLFSNFAIHYRFITIKMIYKYFVIGVILIAYSEAFHLKDLYRKLFHHDYERKFSVPQSKYHDEIRQFENPTLNDNMAVVKQSPLVRKDGTSTEIDEYENRGIAKRGSGKALGTFFKWTIIGGGILGGLSMASAFLRLGFDEYFNNNRGCCGLSCCGGLCAEKEEFDQLKQTLFNNSNLVDKEWVKVEKQVNYIKNLDLLMNQTVTEIDDFDKVFLQFVSTLTSKSTDTLVDMIEARGEQIYNMNLTRNLTDKEIEDLFSENLFDNIETDLWRWRKLRTDNRLMLAAMRRFERFSVNDFRDKFYSGWYKYEHARNKYLNTHGRTFKTKAVANLKVAKVWIARNFVGTTTALFRLGTNVFSVYAIVQDILYIVQQVNECKNLRDKVTEAVNTIKPEVAISKTILATAKETLVNATNEYTSLANTIQKTEFLSFVDEVIGLVENTTESIDASTELASLKSFRSNIVNSPSPDNLEINLLPTFKTTLHDLTKKYRCSDHRMSIVKKSADLCKNMNSTMYGFNDIWGIVTQDQQQVFAAENCNTVQTTYTEFSSFIKDYMTDSGHQEDCFLNSAIAWGRVCNEWRKNITSIQIKANLLTDTISPITSITQTRVDFFVTKGCNKNSLTTNNKNTICSEKATFLTKALMLKFWDRWDTTELTTHYDSCALVDQTLLVNAICNNKATDNTMDLTNSHKVTPMDRYPLSMFTTQYDACALTDALKDEICFLKDDLSLTLSEVMLEPIIKHYPQSLVDAAYNGCVKVMTVDDKDRICRLKTDGCARQGCAFTDSAYDQYKSDFGAANVQTVYNGCSKKDEERYNTVAITSIGFVT